jgi:hypothetical protein
MKIKSYQTTIGITLGAIALVTACGVGAKPPKMKMTTEIPPGIATPDKLETRIGTLNLFDGVPDEETAQKIYDNLDFQRAVQAYLSSIQIASMAGMRKGLLNFGPANTTVLLFENLMDSKALWLTPNTVSIYMTMWLELSDEPMVIETPPNVLGIIDDHWFKYIADFGNAGPTKARAASFWFCLQVMRARFPRDTTWSERIPMDTGSSGAVSRWTATPLRPSTQPRRSFACTLCRRKTIHRR